MELTLTDGRYHRNGVGGLGYVVVVFDYRGWVNGVVEEGYDLIGVLPQGDSNPDKFNARGVLVMGHGVSGVRDTYRGADVFGAALVAAVEAAQEADDMALFRPERWEKPFVYDTEQG